jgi:hypothetical protein
MNLRNHPLSQLPLEKPHGIFADRFRNRFSRAAATQLASRKRNQLYIAYERSLLVFNQQKSLRILFTGKPDWAADITKGFAGSRHRIEFGSLAGHSEGDFDLVMPLQISGLIEARQWPELLAKNPIPIPTEECILLCDDKRNFSQTLIDKGFGRYIPKLCTVCEPPYILKKRIGSWGKECWMVRDKKEEAALRDQVTDPAFYRQEIIRGRSEFATHILFANDRIVKSLDIKYEFDTDIPIKGQDKALYTVVGKCHFLDLFAKILRSIGFEGLCCVNYKVVDGRPYIFEINPRFGGTLCPYFFSFIRHLNC